MRVFVGRDLFLRRLASELTAVRESGDGRLVTIRGRRRVGKTWLVEEFLERARVPFVFYASSAQTEERELMLFAEKLAASSLPSADLAAGARFPTWENALVTAATGATRERPNIIVIDEFPYLLGETKQAQRALLGSFQTAWDRSLSKRPTLLILVGSDLAMMEAITAHGRPLHQRPTRELVVPPLDPVEAAALSGHHGVAALESYLVTGGFPKIVRSWSASASLREFLTSELADDGSPLVATGRQVLDAEFPPRTQARAILSTIGDGFRTRSAIAGAVGVEARNLAGPLETLVKKKRVVEVRLPLSLAKSIESRYEIIDPYLRFFTRFIDPSLGEIERGRGRIAVDAILRDWSTYRGHAIEPLVRHAIERLLPDPRLPGASVVGGYWTRSNVPEIDLVGADVRRPPVKRIGFIGTIKWRDRALLDGGDIAALVRDGASVAGVTPATPLVAVSRNGLDPRIRSAMAASFEPEDLLAAWSSDNADRASAGLDTHAPA